MRHYSHFLHKNVQMTYIRMSHKFLSHNTMNDFNWLFLYKHACLSISRLWLQFQSSQSSFNVSLVTQSFSKLFSTLFNMKPKEAFVVYYA